MKRVQHVRAAVGNPSPRITRCPVPAKAQHPRTDQEAGELRDQKLITDEEFEAEGSAADRL
jgi:hypothetical protein